MKFRWPLLFIVVLLGAFALWRATHPQRDDSEQIRAQLETIRRAAEDKNPRGITSALSDKFSWNGTKRSELNSQLAGFFFTVDKVETKLQIIEVRVTGDTAFSRGTYEVATRSEAGQPFQRRSGSFRIAWRKIEGVWKIEKVDGAENLAQ